ncbi:MAG TPA: hypothetical protein GXX17_06165 [Clostridiales bacterium]|nr:hypothetical protein [Clostridiales bacterium]
MTISEKVYYIKGLAEGLELDESDKTSKLIKAIIDVLDDIALTVEDLEDTCAELSEQIDAVDEDLSNLEDEIYQDMYDEDEEEDQDSFEDEELYEVECPNCNDLIYLEEETIKKGSISCPNCHADLEFDFEETDIDDDLNESEDADQSENQQ